MNDKFKNIRLLIFLVLVFCTGIIAAKITQRKKGNEIQSGCPTCATMNFTYPAKLCIGRTVVFTNTSTQCTGNLNAMWDFGDGTPPSASPYHLYSTPGTYSVKYYIPETPGCTERSVTRNVTIGACKKCVQPGGG